MTQDATIVKDGSGGFSEPTSATSGINDYDQEGTPRRRKKKRPETQTKSKSRKPHRAAKPHGAKPKGKTPKTQVQGENGENVDYDDGNDTTDYEDDDVSEDEEYPNDAEDDDDELEAKKVKKVDITTFNENQLAKFFDLNKAIITSGELVKGVYDVAQLASLISQLKYMADSAAVERQVEGDNSTVPEALREESARLLSVLSSMATEESGEIKNGTTAEDVMRDTQPTMTPGLYRSDVGTLAKNLRASLFGVSEEDLAKAGARNSAKDLETLQKCHDALCELGANCNTPSPHDNDGKQVNPAQETQKMGKVSKTDTVMSEGNKRGASVTDPKMEPQSTNADDAEDTAEGTGAEKPNNDTKKGKTRPNPFAAEDAKKGKKRADMDEDEDEDMDDEDDADDADDAPPAKKPKKKAAKSFSIDDDEGLAKMIAMTVAATMQAMNKADGGTQKVIPRVAPNLMQVGKGGDVSNLQNVDVDTLRKSVTKVVGQPAGAGDNDTATLIKAIHKAGPQFRLSPNEIPQS